MIMVVVVVVPAAMMMMAIMDAAAPDPFCSPSSLPSSSATLVENSQEQLVLVLASIVAEHRSRTFTTVSLRRVSLIPNKIYHLSNPNKLKIVPN